MSIFNKQRFIQVQSKTAIICTIKLVLNELYVNRHGATIKRIDYYLETVYEFRRLCEKSESFKCSVYIN